MKFVKLKPSDTSVDHRYQRELDAKRVEAMARSYDANLIGVPVVSRRADGSLVRIDGQHRLATIIAAGHGDTAIMMEVHDGLSVQEESALFLRLNGGRTIVGAIDKFKARLVAKEPTAMEIDSILKSVNCKITKSPQRGGIMAVQAVESAYHKGNLGPTMVALSRWLENSPEAFDGTFIRAVSAFLSAHPDADPAHLAARLEQYAPAKLRARLKREFQQAAFSHSEVARMVISEIYNYRTPKGKRVVRAAA